MKIHAPLDIDRLAHEGVDRVAVVFRPATSPDSRRTWLGRGEIDA